MPTAEERKNVEVIVAQAKANHDLSREVRRLRQNIEYAIELVDAGFDAEAVAIMLSRACTWRRPR